MPSITKSISLLGPIFTFVIPLAFSANLFAQWDAYKKTAEKAEKKQQSRWSLSEWMEQKNKMQLMDMWLMMNTNDDPFEFFLGYDQARYNQTLAVDLAAPTSSQYNIYFIRLAAYATFLGLQAEKFDSSEGFEGYNYLARLRLLGDSLQNTNFIVEYGISRRDDNSISNLDHVDLLFYGSSITLYITKHLGLWSLYRLYQEATSKNSLLLSGQDVEAALFVDYGLIRIEGTYLKENLRYFDQGTPQVSKTKREGVLIGMKVFF